MTETKTVKMCPFCPLLLPGQEDMWNPIGNDFFGEPASIGGVPSCGDCAQVVEIGGNAAELVAQVKGEEVQ